MNSIKLKYIFFVLLVALAGCRKDEKIEVPTVIDPTGDPTIEVVSGVTGLVTDEDGNPITNASVSVYNKEVSTDENGIFYINNEGLRQVNSSVIVKKSGFFDGFKSFIPAVGKKSFIQIQLIDRGDPNFLLSSEGGILDISGGAELSLPANSVVVKDGGEPYNGDVQIFTHWYDPTDPDLGISMPGNLLGVLEDESEVQLATYGMIAVELESSNGIALQLADNAKATLRFPVSEILNAPNAIPLWSFDESDLVWVQKGEAVLEDGFYRAEVSHFSFWGCAAPFPLIMLEGRILEGGNPITNFPVTITTEGLLSAQGYTDNEGVFRGNVPKGENLLLTMRHCEQTVLSQELGPFEADENVGTIDVGLSTFTTTVTGRMVSCEFEPLQSAYGLLRSGEDVVQVITPIADGSDADGTFSAIVVGCENSLYTIQFVDPENLRSTGIMDISTSIGVNIFEDVRICDDLEEYIEYSVNGELAPVIMEVDVYISNDEKVLIRGGSAGEFKFFDMDVFATDEGDYNPSGMFIEGPVGSSNLKLFCGDHLNNAIGCDQFEVNIMEFGDYISGTFSGILVTDTDSLQPNQIEYDEYMVDGSFNVKVDEFINTGEISGQFWVDEIPNNVRDPEEDLTMPKLQVTLQTVSGSEISLFPNFLISNDNSYKFTNLLPGTYIVWVRNGNIYEAVIKNVGSEDQDCDFEFNNGNKFFLSDEQTISQSESIQNVDLGIILPDFVNITNAFYTGCIPNIRIVTNIKGGLPPFMSTLSDGQTTTSTSSTSFIVETGGSYEIETIDAVGNTASFSLFVNDYNNRVRGRTWRDIQGGESGVYDSNDQELHNVGILLFNDDNELISETVSEEGWYQFSNVVPGNYYVQVNTPSGLEILIQNTTVTNGNDINQESGRSDIILVENCDANIRVDAGFN